MKFENVFAETFDLCFNSLVFIKAKCGDFNTHSYSGSLDGKVHIWSADSGKRITIIDGMHPGPCQNIKFNPKYMMLATACSNLVLSFFN